MARREEFEIKIKCSNCQHCGTVIIEENENPVFHGEGRKIMSVSEGFTNRDGQVYCDKCGTLVE